MRNLKTVLLTPILLLAALPARATIQIVNTDPSGACVAPTYTAVNVTTGQFSDCVASVWAKVRASIGAQFATVVQVDPQGPCSYPPLAFVAVNGASGAITTCQFGQWATGPPSAQISAQPGSTWPGFTAAAFNFTPVAGVGNLTGGVGTVQTFNPCPFGVNATDSGHYIYLSGGVGTVEATLITGGTCTSGATTGTLIFTPANSHSGAWTMSSASGGLQEAICQSLPGAGDYVVVAANLTLQANVGLCGTTDTHVDKYSGATITAGGFTILAQPVPAGIGYFDWGNGPTILENQVQIPGGLSGTIPGTPTFSGIVTFTSGIAGLRQGTSNKPQMANGSFVSGDCLNYDANGNAVDFGAGCGGPWLNSATFIWTQTLGPAQSLTGGVGNSPTLTPCPLGVNGTDLGHSLYISGGTGAAEAVLINGGSCTSGAASGTINFAPANNHTGAWSIATATAGTEEAAWYIQGTGAPGNVAVPNGNNEFYAGFVAPGGLTFGIRGGGPGTIIVVNQLGVATYSAFSFGGASSGAADLFISDLTIKPPSGTLTGFTGVTVSSNHSFAAYAVLVEGLQFGFADIATTTNIDDYDHVGFLANGACPAGSVGFSSTGGGNVAVRSSDFSCGSTTNMVYGILVASTTASGGFWFRGNDIYHAQYCMAILPQAGIATTEYQLTDNFENACTVNGILINAVGAGSQITAVYIKGDEPAGSGSAGVVIGGGSGLEQGITLTNVATYLGTADGIQLKAGIFGLVQLNGVLSYNNGGNGLTVAAGVSNWATSGSFYEFNTGYGVSVAAGSSNEYSIIANNLFYNTAGPINDLGTGTSKIISSNQGVDAGQPSIATAATITLPAGDNRNIYLTGTGTVTTINGGQAGQLYTFTNAGSGVITIGPGANIGPAATLSPNNVIILLFTGVSWFTPPNVFGAGTGNVSTSGVTAAFDIPCFVAPTLIGGVLPSAQVGLPFVSGGSTACGSFSNTPSLGPAPGVQTQTWVVGVGGTTANTLVTPDASNPAKIIAGGAYGIAQSTQLAAANVEVARYGIVNCVTDTGGATAGDLVIVGTGTAIDCKDAGVALLSQIPIGTRVVGIFRSSAVAGALALVELTPWALGTQVSFTIVLASDFITANNTNLQPITDGTNTLAFTVSANRATVAKIECDLIYNQQTVAQTDAFGIQDVTVAPTNIEGTGFVQTNTTTWADLVLDALASTTATNIVTFTPSAITTLWHAQVRASIIAPSNAAASVVQIMARTGAGADTLTVKKGSSCLVTIQ